MYSTVVFLSVYEDESTSRQVNALTSAATGALNRNLLLMVPSLFSLEAAVAEPLEMITFGVFTSVGMFFSAPKRTRIPKYRKCVSLSLFCRSNVV